MKSFDGLVFDTSLRFHPAVPASNHPALSPTRGSGVGFVVPTLTFGPAAVPADDNDVDEPEDAHAAAVSAAATTGRNVGSLIEWDARGGKREGEYRERSLVASASIPASASCDSLR